MSMVPGRIDEISGAWPGRALKFPSVPGTTTISTISESSRRSGVTSSNCRRSGIDFYLTSGRFCRHLLSLRECFVDGADHVEGALGQVVMITGDNALEALDRLFEVDEHPGGTGEYFGDEKGLRQKLLNLACPRHGQLVLLGQLVHAQNRNDVLQRLVGLQHSLYVARHLVVVLAND